MIKNHKDSKNLLSLIEPNFNKLLEYNPEYKEQILFNKEQVLLLLSQIKDELEAYKKFYPDINLIRKNLKKKSKKFIISKDYNIGNVFSFGANIDNKPNSYALIMFPYKENPLGYIKFRYYPRSRTFRNLFNKLIMSLRTEKIDYSYIIDKGKNPNYITISINNERHNEKFWRILKLWSKN